MENTGINQITDIAHQYAADANIKLTSITFDDGRPLGIKDIHLMQITARKHTVNVKLYHEEIEDYLGRDGSELTRAKIRNAIERLQVMLEG